jgi:acyl carrier protein
MTDHFATVKTDICKLLQRRGPLPEAIDDYRYLDAGHISSIALMEFVLELEMHFNIELSPLDLQSDEFRTIAGLAKIVQQKCPL